MELQILKREVDYLKLKKEIINHFEDGSRNDEILDCKIEMQEIIETLSKEDSKLNVKLYRWFDKSFYV